jgi:hypothetical protein
MTAYHIALLLHLLSLLLATAASALLHFAAHRRAQAPTLRESVEWARFGGRTARMFPLAIVLLVLTGAFMVSRAWSWHLGWVQAGLVGALYMPVAGAVIGARTRAAVGRSMQRLAEAGSDPRNDQPGDAVAEALGNANTWLAVGIVLIMTMKPGLAESVAVLVLAAVVGAYRGARRAGAPAVGRASRGDDAEAELV